MSQTITPSKATCNLCGDTIIYQKVSIGETYACKCVYLSVEGFKDMVEVRYNRSRETFYNGSETQSWGNMKRKKIIN